MVQYKVDFQSAQWHSPANGVRFKVHQHEGRQLRLAEFTSDFVERDWCTKGHIGYILEGRMEIDFDGKVVVFEPGVGLFIPAGEEHKHKAQVLTDVVKVILVESA